MIDGTKVALFDNPTSWSRLCIDHLNSRRFQARLLPPTDDSIREDEVRTQLHIVRLSGPNSDKFPFLKKINDLGGLSVAVIGSSQNEVAFMLWTTIGVIPCVGPSINFTELTDALHRLEPRLKRHL